LSKHAPASSFFARLLEKRRLPPFHFVKGSSHPQSLVWISLYLPIYGDTCGILVGHSPVVPLDLRWWFGFHGPNRKPFRLGSSLLTLFPQQTREGVPCLQYLAFPFTPRFHTRPCDYSLNSSRNFPCRSPLKISLTSFAPSTIISFPFRST